MKFLPLATLMLLACSEARVEQTTKKDSVVVSIPEPPKKTTKEIIADSIQKKVQNNLDDPSSYQRSYDLFLDTIYDSSKKPCGYFIAHHFRAKNKFGALIKASKYVQVDAATNKVIIATSHFENLKNFKCGKGKLEFN